MLIILSLLIGARRRGGRGPRRGADASTTLATTLDMLDDDQLRQLVQRGYVVLDAFLDPALTAAARDRLWDFSLPGMVRDDPSTHVGPFTPDEQTTGPTGNRRGGWRWQVTSMGQEDVLLDLLPRNPAVRAIVSQLLGESFTDSAPDWSNMGKRTHGEGAWTRGVYCTLPRAIGTTQEIDAPGGCHIDSDLGSRDRLGAIAYLDDVVSVLLVYFREQSTPPLGRSDPPLTNTGSGRRWARCLAREPFAPQ